MTKEECIEEALTTMRVLLEATWNQGVTFGMAQTMKHVEAAINAGIPAPRTLPTGSADR